MKGSRITITYSTQTFCSDCGKSFSTPSELRKHNRATHIKTPSEIYQICGDEFLQNYKLMNHMVLKNTIANTKQKVHICDFCEFHTRYFIKNIHFKHREGQLRVFYPKSWGVYECDDCEFLCNKLQQLKEHIATKVYCQNPNLTSTQRLGFTRK